MENTLARPRKARSDPIFDSMPPLVRNINNNNNVFAQERSMNSKKKFDQLIRARRRKA
jgi:hypothetical protein